MTGRVERCNGATGFHKSGHRSRIASVTAVWSHPAWQCHKTVPSSFRVMDRDGEASSCTTHLTLTDVRSGVPPQRLTRSSNEALPCIVDPPCRQCGSDVGVCPEYVGDDCGTRPAGVPRDGVEHFDNNNGKRCANVSGLPSRRPSTNGTVY